MVSFLCLRRGVSITGSFGCDDRQLFSAYAEVFLRASGIQCIELSFLCLRRGVSAEALTCEVQPALFSAYAEVFPPGRFLPDNQAAFFCLRRGVSKPKRRCALSYHFSLPTQRCFRNPETRGVKDRLFSAYAEVFPIPSPFSTFRFPFLCLRRGVSSSHWDS